jgi:protein TonB
VIGRDGRIVSLEVLSGPPALQQASLNAVRQWRYQPYLLDGEPVEVETQILVMFALSTSVERF